MGTGIIVCGLNGAGKSTLGRALAKEWECPFLDAEDFFFPKTDPARPYDSPRTRHEAEALLARRIQDSGRFVFASVRGDYGEAFSRALRCAVWLSVPRDIRLRRVKNRSYERFGERMLPGGDLYEQETRFFDFVQSRTEDDVAEWIQTLTCPVIRLDGREPVEENVKRIIATVQN